MKKSNTNYIAEEMLKCTGKLFQETSINYFDYARKYKDESSFILATDMGYVNHFTKSKKYEEEPPTLLTTGKHLWLEYIDPTFLNIASNEFNHANGITIINEHAEYNEIYNFAAPANKHRVYDIYLNNFEILNHFVLNFVDSAQKLIEFGENTPLFSIGKQSSTIIDIPTKNYCMLHGKPHLLTNTEAHCLAYLIAGYSAKSTAECLQNSYRTVQKHLENIRAKLQVNSSLQLVCDIQNKNDFLNLIR